MHRHETVKKEEPSLPPRETGVFLGIWMAVFIVLAFAVVPWLFTVCAPAASP
jgi:hypothetical protein